MAGNFENTNSTYRREDVRASSALRMRAQWRLLAMLLVHMALETSSVTYRKVCVV